MRIAYNKLSKNKGALTPGTENSTADGFSESLINQISASLMCGTFKWSAIRRIYIPKPGKSEKRPLGLPDFSNKLVQEGIRLVLVSIYEPEFEKYETNYGFRPNRDCNDAIQDILTNANGSDWVIEGDIKGAFDNVDHKILINILKQRIHDNRFLKLIYSGLKSGIMDNLTIQPSLLGIPQGGIASPYLFNIYMHELDKFIVDVLKPQYELIPKTDKVTSEYAALKSQSSRSKKKISEIQSYPSNESSISLITKLEHPKFLKLISDNPEVFQPIFLTPNSKYQQYADLANNPLQERHVDLFRKYQRLRNKKNNEKTVSLDQYPIDEQLIIKEVNSKMNKLKDLKRNLLKQIEESGIDVAPLFLKSTKIILSKTKQSMLNTPYFEIEGKKIKIFFKRFADD